MTLPLNQQVTSLEYSKKLKELGVPQDSLFYWIGFGKYDSRWLYQKYVLSYSKTRYPDYRVISAYTVGELGEMLPRDIETKTYPNYYSLVMQAPFDKGLYPHKWLLEYVNYLEEERKYYRIGRVEAETEANARAQMLIWLIKKGHLDVTNLKKGE